jgi:hypothetical protein
MSSPTTSTGVWEVRPTVGIDTNGAGFDSTASGTDYSKQNAKNSAGSNISTTDLTTTTTGGFTCTSASAAFTSAITGNFIYLSGGTGGTVTTGWYYATYASATTITLDRSPGAAATLVTMNIGGALATVSQAYTNSVASATIYVKASGTYTVTTALVIILDSSSSPGRPLSIIGYTTTRGDGGQFTWTTATNSVNLISVSSGSTQGKNILLQNINFTTTAGTKKNAIESASNSVNSACLTVINCTITGFLVGIEGNSNVNGAFNGLYVYNSRITGCTSHGVRNGAMTYMYASVMDANAGDGFNTTIAQFPNVDCGWVFERCIFYNNSVNGLNSASDNTLSGTFSQYIICSGCVFSSNTSAGILFEAAICPLLQSINCIYNNNGTYGINFGGTNGVGWAPNFCIYNNAFNPGANSQTATLHCGTGINPITLTAVPFVADGTNFALNATAGGGALLSGLGFPGVLNFGGTGYASVGALEVQAGVATVPLTVSIQDPLWYGV